MSNYYETRYTFDEGRSKVWRAITEYLQKYVNDKTDCVLDLGAGYCDFINNINAPIKFPVGTTADITEIKIVFSSCVQLKSKLIFCCTGLNTAS